MKISYSEGERTITVEACSPLGFEAVGLLSCKDLRQVGFRAPNTIYVQSCESEPAFGVRLRRKDQPVQIIRAVAWSVDPEKSIADAIDETLRAVGDALRISAAQLAGDHLAASAGVARVDPHTQVALPAHLEQLEAVWPGPEALDAGGLKL